MKLMPYGSSHFAGVVAKVGNSKSTPNLAPYGQSERADLVAKVGDSKSTTEAPDTRRVVRRSARS